MKRKPTLGRREITNKKSKKGTVKDLKVKGVRGGSIKGGGSKMDFGYKAKTSGAVLREQ